MKTSVLEGLTLLKEQAQALRLLSEGRNCLCGSQQGIWQVCIGFVLPWAVVCIPRGNSTHLQLSSSNSSSLVPTDPSPIECYIGRLLGLVLYLGVLEFAHMSEFLSDFSVYISKLAS